MVLVFRTSVPSFTMSKGLPDTNAPPGVFQMFNENRTFYFESDISSLPLPPCTHPGPVQPAFPKLRKTQSQPQLVTTDCVQLLASTHISAVPPPPPADNLQLPTAVMAPVQREVTSTDSSSSTYNSLETRYQTEPTFKSSQILKSFHSEFRLFGHNRDRVNTDTQVERKSYSTPNSPRRASSPELDFGALRSYSDSDPRKLSLVKEETAEQVDVSRSVVPATPSVSESEETMSYTRRGSLMSSIPNDTMDAEPKKANMPLTRKVMTWLTTPQKEVSINKKEFNAMGPTSF